MPSSVVFPLLVVIIALSILPALSVPKAADTLTTPGANAALLEPLLPSINSSDVGEQGKRSTIEGLLLPPHDGSLKKRQDYCVDSGYGVCSRADYCCPIGGDCCTARRNCCKVGEHCCSVRGCCEDTHNCVILSDGTPGCCLIGKTCTNGGGGGSGFGPTTTPLSIASLTTSAGITSIPTPADRSLSWLALDDLRIIWRGSWSTVSGAEALCNTTTTTRTCRGTTTSSFSTHAMILTFNGPSLYLRVAAWNARYDFEVNGLTISEHGSSSSRTTVKNCTYIQWQGTRGSNTLRVQVYGYAVSQPFNVRDGLEDTGLKKRDGGDWSFQLSDLVVEDNGPGITPPSNWGVSKWNGLEVRRLGAISITLLALATLY